MKRLRDYSLRGKLTFILTAAVTLALIFALSAAILREVVWDKREHLNRYATLTQALAVQLAPTLAFDDPRAAEEVLSVLRLEPDVPAAWVRTARGAVFAGYRAARIPYSASPQELAPPRAEAAFWARAVSLDQDIVLDGEVLGSIAVTVDLSELWENIWLDSLSVAAAALVGLIAAILLAHRLQRTVTGPILRLADTVERVSGERDYALRAVKTADDETGALTDGFNEMLNQIQLRDQELTAHRAHLEELVAQRTAELVKARDTAEKASRAKSEFLSSMSHELRTPLNAVLGFAQLLQTEDDPPLSAAQQESVQEILSAGEHLLALINDVLDLARIESGGIQLSIEPVNLGEALAECGKLVGPVLAKHPVELDLAVADCTRHAVYADHVRLRQALLNLISNAMKYNRPGGAVTVSCLDIGGGWLRIAVSDTGAGIPPERQKDLFTAFNRLGAEGGAIEGTGIGLVITRRLVEQMGGGIGFESEPGQGSTFWIELPAAPPGEAGGIDQASAGQAARASAPQTPQRTVLCVEDNPASLRLIEQVLADRLNVRVLGAHLPQLGLELAARHRPELILLDINLPDMDGYEVLRRLRAAEATRDIPVIAVSANAWEGDIGRGREAGFADYFTKPLDIPRLLAAAGQLLQPG